MSRPVLVKMRLGNGAPADYVALARRLGSAGADALIVHGRTARQGYSGRADWNAVAEIKRALAIPVIVNGDVVDGPSAEAALRESGADGVAIGRAALGNPRVFAQVTCYLRDGSRLPPPSLAERAADLAEYVAMAEAHGIVDAQIREQAQQFTRGLPGAARMRDAMNKAASVREATEVLLSLAAPAAI